MGHSRAVGACFVQHAHEVDVNGSGWCTSCKRRAGPRRNVFRMVTWRKPRGHPRASGYARLRAVMNAVRTSWSKSLASGREAAHVSAALGDLASPTTSPSVIL
jgi:hypothetical protein